MGIFMGELLVYQRVISGNPGILVTTMTTVRSSEGKPWCGGFERPCSVSWWMLLLTCVLYKYQLSYIYIIQYIYILWVCIFLGSATLSKAEKFDFGETDPRNRPSKQTLEFKLYEVEELCETGPRNIPRNRPAKQTPEANFPSRTPHFETPPHI